MSFRPTSLRIFAALLALTLALLAGWALWQRRHPALPQVVALLPDGQILFYANLVPLRGAGLLGHSPVPYAPAYAAFIQQSGFDFERDAQAVGLSLQGLPSGPHQTMLLLQASFQPRFFAYLKAGSGHPGELDGHPLYSAIGADGPVQILVLNPRLIALTNASDRSAFVPVLQRYEQWWQRPQPPRLWQQLGASQPRGALGWLAVDYASLASQQTPTGWLALLRGSRTLLLRLDADPIRGAELSFSDATVLPADASRITRQLQNLLALYQQHAQTDAQADTRMLQLLRKVRFEQQGSRLRAIFSLPPQDVKTLFQVAPPPPAAAPQTRP